MPRAHLATGSLAVLGCLLAHGANAETTFETHVNHWTIQARGESCSAQNRPLSELGSVPINTLIIFAEAGGDLSLAMAFWPGALTEADDEMTLMISGRGGFDLPAEALLEPWTVLRNSSPLPDKLLTTFGSYEGPPLYNMTVVARVSGTETLIDIQDMPRVVAELQRCLTVLSPNP
jgi:hypothetical protein